MTTLLDCLKNVHETNTRKSNHSLLKRRLKKNKLGLRNCECTVTIRTNWQSKLVLSLVCAWSVSFLKKSKQKAVRSGSSLRQNRQSIFGSQTGDTSRLAWTALKFWRKVVQLVPFDRPLRRKCLRHFCRLIGQHNVRIGALRCWLTMNPDVLSRRQRNRTVKHRRSTWLFSATQTHAYIYIKMIYAPTTRAAIGITNKGQRTVGSKAGVEIDEQMDGHNRLHYLARVDTLSH